MADDSRWAGVTRLSGVTDEYLLVMSEIPSLDRRRDGDTVSDKGDARLGQKSVTGYEILVSDLSSVFNNGNECE